MTSSPDSLLDFLNLQRYGDFVSELKKLNSADCSITLETLRQKLKEAPGFFSSRVAGQLCECLSMARSGENYDLFDSVKWEHGPYWALDAIKYFQQQDDSDYLLDSTEKEVAIIVKEGGAVAILKLDLVKDPLDNPPNNPPVIFPSAQTNSFVEVASDTRNSIQLSFDTAIDYLKRNSNNNQTPRGVNFRWEIRRMDGVEVTGLSGGSLGGEFSILFYRLLQDYFKSAKSMKTGEG